MYYSVRPDGNASFFWQGDGMNFLFRPTSQPQFMSECKCLDLLHKEVNIEFEKIELAISLEEYQIQHLMSQEMKCLLEKRNLISLQQFILLHIKGQILSWC
ncbi:hypothetical protein Y1Q_0013231 [Alligator mississippiensis]|uniref:Uncharacterized protein n=1 Tax=Alligator mississippiensis TaxID=8496 RepID=A0A151NU76_ALLMI|nr:hypothetical protein Y1Q_0013231 [Alligator mississippiensis]